MFIDVLNIVSNKLADVRPALSGPPKAKIKNIYIYINKYVFIFLCLNLVIPTFIA